MAADALEHFRARIGQDTPPGDWLLITQDRVNQFADVTDDHQFIHVDPERAKNTQFGGTIAHGFLTLSLCLMLPRYRENGRAAESGSEERQGPRAPVGSGGGRPRRNSEHHANHRRGGGSVQAGRRRRDGLSPLLLIDIDS